jgi:hypothetical protein
MQPIRVSIVTSEPWELGVATNWVPIKCELVSVQHGGRALLQLATPIAYRGATYAFAVASPRLPGQGVENIVAGTRLCASLVGITNEQAGSADPFDTSGWRGGLAFIGDIERAM